MKPKADFSYMLAPMEGYTNPAFRTLCYNHGADLTFTEMVRADALAKNNKATILRANIPDATPTVIQLLAGRLEPLEDYLKTFEPENGFAGFNLNIGCPSPEVVGAGQGCALVKRINKVAALAKAIKDHGHPVSIKLRLGMNKFEKEKMVYLNLIKSVDADFFVVHARTGIETFMNKADWSVFKQCARTRKRIIANGDVRTVRGINFLKEMGVSGVMVGRAALENPGIFEVMKSKPRLAKLDELKKEFVEISKKLNTPEKNTETIMKLFGKGTEKLKESSE
jgi:tRNA-dihydrouridine synthase B